MFRRLAGYEDVNDAERLRQAEKYGACAQITSGLEEEVRDS